MPASGNTKTGKNNVHRYRSGMAAFFLSGFCAISSGIIVSILRDRYGFKYSFSGTLVSVMSIGNMTALLLSGLLPGIIGEKATTLILCSGYFLGYLFMALTGNPVILLLAFLLAGISKGTAANKCTILVGNNTDDRPKALSLMNAWFALGALMCPFLISVLQKRGDYLPAVGVSVIGLLMWLVFFNAGLPGRVTSSVRETGKTGFSFLKSGTFWLLAMLIFCQNAAEYTVNGWVVTYYKNEQILSGTVAAYVVTVQWIMTLTARLLLAFRLKTRNLYLPLSVMGVGMTVMYIVLLQMHTAVPALIALGLLSFSLAGVYPLAVASVGEMMSSASIGIILAIGGAGGIIFPFLVGIIADVVGLRNGMMVNVIPCIGIVVLPLILQKYDPRLPV